MAANYSTTYSHVNLAIRLTTIARSHIQIHHIHILGNGLELACNGGSFGGISLKRDECCLHLKRFPALASVAR